MKLQIVLVLCLFCLLDTIFAGNECSDPRKEYRRCQSSSCVKTCENPNPTLCTLDCRPGCYCKDPFVLEKSTNKCINLSQCKRLCRANEEYKKCGTCDATCARPKPICAQKCRPGCFCKPGFLRHNNACIRASACPKPRPPKPE